MQFQGNPEVFIHSTDADITLRGRELDFGSAKGVSAQFGDNTPVAVASGSYSNPTLTVTTVNPHNFKTGQTIKLKGDTGAGAAINNLAGGYACTVTGTNTFTLAVGAGSAALTVTAQSTTTLVDGSKNWATNQWADQVLTYNTTQGSNGAHNAVRILSNTATTLTFAATTAPVQGISRYAITTKPVIGAYDSGIATGTQSTTTLQDTSKTWDVGTLVGKYLMIVAGTGLNQKLLITANTANTLTFAAGTAPVAAVSVYSISNSTSVVGAGAGLNWVFNNTGSLKDKGRYLIRTRGGGLLGFERFNLRSDTLELLQPQDNFETFNIGSMSAYDGQDIIYIVKEVASGSLGRLLSYNVNTNRLSPAGDIGGSAFLAPIYGNRMEVYEAIGIPEAGVKFLWLNKASSFDNVRTILWWE
jgi:hypothetical protein